MRHLAQGFASDPPTLPRRLDAPARLPCLGAVVVDLPEPDAPDPDAVRLDAEHVRIAGGVEAKVALVPLDQLLAGLGATEMACHLGCVGTLEKGEVRISP